MYGLCSLASGIPICLADDVMTFAAGFFGLLFFGGAMVPSLNGIMLNSVPPEMRTSANSLASVCSNLFGYLPAPSFYGLLAYFVDDETSKIPFVGLISTMCLTIFLLITGIIIKVRRESLETNIE